VSDDGDEQARRPVVVRLWAGVLGLPWRQMVGAFVAVAVPLTMLATAVALTSILYAALLAIAFVVGVVAVPLGALTVGKSLPHIVREPLAELILMLGALPFSRAVIEQQPDGSYEFVAADGHDGPRRAWARWLFSEIAVGVRVSDETWPDLSLPEETVAEWAKRTPKPGDTAPQAPISRAGETTFVPDVDDDDVVIPLAEPLSRLRDVAGVGEGYESESAGIEEFGGDTAGFTGTGMLAGTLLFTLLGLGLGWVLFL
jgi:hypothetical protein